MKVFQYGLGNGEAIIGARATANLVKDHQGSGRTLCKDGAGFHHFHHKGGLACRQIVLGAHAREDTVHEANAGGCRRHEGSDLREKHNQRDLPQVGGLSRHVWSGQHKQAPVVVQYCVIWHKCHILLGDLDYGMTASLYGNAICFVEQRPAIAPFKGDRGERSVHVDLCHRIRASEQRGSAFRHQLAQGLQDLKLDQYALLLRVKNPRLVLFELGGDVAFTARDRRRRTYSSGTCARLLLVTSMA